MENKTININQNPSLLSGEWMNLIKSFNECINELPELKRKALNTAGYILQESVRDEFIGKMPAAGRPFKVPATSKGGYKLTKPDRLADAVRQSSATSDHVTVFMGGRDPGSPLFISRMYDSGTKERKTKTYAGKKLKKGRKVGSVSGVHYWDPGINKGEAEAFAAMNRIFDNYIKNILQK
jgi:hypothetical protein